MSERTRKIESRTSGSAERDSIRTNAVSSRARDDEGDDRRRRAPAVRGRIDEPVDEHHQPARHRDRAGDVVALVCVLVLRLRHEPQRCEEGEDPDRHVDEEDPAPRERLRERAAEHEADGRAADRDRGPDAERPATRSFPSANVVEMIESAAGEMSAAPRPCSARKPISIPDVVAMPFEERRDSEDHEPDEEEPLPSQEVAHAPAEQQEAGEDERVRVDHPLQAGLGEAERGLDVRAGRRSRSSRRGRP